MKNWRAVTSVTARSPPLSMMARRFGAREQETCDVTDPRVALILVFIVLEVKHYIFDYVLQTPYQFRNKGFYGHFGGLIHAGLQALGSLAAFLVIAPSLALGLAIVAGEFVVHYHVDWSKEQILRRMRLTTTDAGYWRVYGADQLAHHLTYIAIAAALALA
jgi:hypothetical protein